MSNSVKKLNKLANAELKYLVTWVNANNISLNVKKKTEIVIFKAKQKKFEGDSRPQSTFFFLKSKNIVF